MSASPLLRTVPVLALLLAAAPSAAEPTGTEVRRDLVFARVDGTDLRLDLYRPGTGEPPFPVLVWIHGGAWRAGSKANCPLAWLAGEGIAVASVEYRLSHQATFPAQIHDVKAAVRWLRAHATEHGLDPSRIGAAGSSAGGHLAALLGTTGGVGAAEGSVGDHPEASSRVRAVYDLFGPADVPRMSSDLGDRASGRASPWARLLRGLPEDLPDLARLASPVAHASGDDPPFRIVHGAADRVVPVAQSERLHEALRKAGVESTLRVLPEAGHGGPAFGDATEREALLSFLRRHLVGGKAASPGPEGARDRLERALKPGPHASGRTDLVLRDEERGKDLPVAVTWPKAGGAHPVILFSHGAFGSKDGYRPLAEHWASHGYVVLQPTHEDSLSRREDGAPLGAWDAFRRWRSRVADAKFLLDRRREVAARIPQAGFRLDERAIGVGGHSFGAHTSQLLAGATTREAGRTDREGQADPRPKAFLLISPQGRGDPLDAESWRGIDRPLLVVTGTNDRGRGGQSYEWRTDPYALSPEGRKHLAVLPEASHGFGGIAGPARFPRSGPARPEEVDLVLALGLLFFDAYVRDDPAALDALRPEVFEAALPGRVRLESR